MFLQQQDFGKVMSCEVFEVIHVSILSHDPELFNHEQASHDPLHHNHNLLNHFLQSAAKMPTNLTNSPFIYYAVVSSTFTYCHSMVDNHSGNTTPENAAQAYCRLFPEMWTPYNNFLCASDSAVKGESASALWVLQMAHHTK